MIVFTYNLILRYFSKLGRVGLNLEVHHSWTEVIHVKTVDYLIMLIIAWRPDVNYFPVQSARQLSEAFESYVEHEW